VRSTSPGSTASGLVRVGCGKYGEASGPRVDSSVVDVPAEFVGFGAVEAATSSRTLWPVNAASDDFVGDVCGIHPVVGDGGFREFGGGSTVGKTDGAEGWPTGAK
jgi:hypothetical protein